MWGWGWRNRKNKSKNKPETKNEKTETETKTGLGVGDKEIANGEFFPVGVPNSVGIQAAGLPCLLTEVLLRPSSTAKAAKFRGPQVRC